MLQSSLIYENVCAVSPQDFGEGNSHVLIRNQEGGEFVVAARGIPGFAPGYIALNEKQRQWARIAQLDTFMGMPYDPFRAGKNVYLGAVEVSVSFASPSKKTEYVYSDDELIPVFLGTFRDQILQPGQFILMDHRGTPLLVTINGVTLTNLGQQEGSEIRNDPGARGILVQQTEVLMTADGRDQRVALKLKSSATGSTRKPIITASFNFSQMGIGGLDDEFAILFRRAFASRVFPPKVAERLRIQHVKGMLLYGPPGTGKTLIARQIGKVLNAKEPKVINGPEVLNKYVGQSEENIRKIFADAEKEYKERGDESDLHVIIFDELDAVCKQRGSGVGGGTGVGDSIVNQLLTKLDGVDQLNNILLIGMTNRKDMIDDALLRPGRLELQLEISLPDEFGRVQILNIHTSKMKENGVLGDDVNIEEIAKLTKNFSGAEIAGLVRSATSFALNRHIEANDKGVIAKNVENMKVGHDDFVGALAEIIPAFGVAEDSLDLLLPMGIIKFNPPQFDKIFREGLEYCNTVRQSDTLRHLSVLFHGPLESGKTALTAYLAKQSDFPFIKVLSPMDLVPYRDDFAKKDYIHKVFADAYKSPISLLIIDDFESIIEYSPIGPRFSNVILPALITLIRTPPPKGRRLLTFVTTSHMGRLKRLQVDTYFPRQVKVGPVRTLEELAEVLVQSKTYTEQVVRYMCEEIRSQVGPDRSGQFVVGLGIKTVLTFLEEAKVMQNNGQDGVEAFVQKVAEAIVTARVELENETSGQRQSFD